MRSQADWKQTISTVEDLASLVGTMKSLAAVSIRQYQIALDSLTEYNHTLELGFKALWQSGQFNITSYEKHQPPDNLGAIIFGSDQGLCGSFNEVIVAHALDKMNDLQVKQTRRRLLLVGSRLEGLLEQHDMNVQKISPQPSSADTIASTVDSLLIDIEQWQEREGIQHVFLFYNQQTKDMVHQPQMTRLLPVDFRKFQSLQNGSWPGRGLPAYSMPVNTLFSSLIKQHLFVSLCRATADSLASEHASRLQSMQGAERSIKKRLESLTSEYQRSRQSAITEEILEIVGGYELLKADFVV